MKRYFVLLLLFISLSTFSQIDKGIIVKVSKDLASRINKNSYKLVFNNYKVGIGIQLFQQLDFIIETGFMNKNRWSYGGKILNNIQVIKLGINVDYRVLKNARFSPKIDIDGGFFPYSNMKGKRIFDVTSNLGFLIDESGKSPYQFGRWRGYFDARLFLSVKLKNLIIDLGGGIGIVNYSLQNKRPKTILEANIMFRLNYVFPLKKKE